MIEEVAALAHGQIVKDRANETLLLIEGRPSPLTRIDTGVVLLSVVVGHGADAAAIVQRFSVRVTSQEGQAITQAPRDLGGGRVVPRVNVAVDKLHRAQLRPGRAGSGRAGAGDGVVDIVEALQEMAD